MTTVKEAAENAQEVIARAGLDYDPETGDYLVAPPIGIYAALAAAAGQMQSIAKDQTNEGQGFKFRSIETIVGHAKPILAAHEISIVPTSSVSRHESVANGKATRCIVEMTWQISHSDGSHIIAAQSGEAIDYGDKSTSKASQMAYKYMLTQMLGIGSEDADAISHDIAEDVHQEVWTQVVGILGDDAEEWFLAQLAGQEIKKVETAEQAEKILANLP